MKVLMINGGPHKNGTTNAALEEMAKVFAEEGIESEIVWVGNKPISGCLACMMCAKTGDGRCAINDIVNDILDMADEADGFVFGTPVHYGGASGAITSLMDRMFYANTPGFYMKPAAAIVAARRGGCSAAWDQLNKYFGLASMPIVTSQYWNMLHGANADEAPEDGEGLQTMRTLARNMAFLLKCKQVAMENGVELPKKEPRVWTNFVRQ